MSSEAPFTARVPVSVSHCPHDDPFNSLFVSLISSVLSYVKGHLFYIYCAFQHFLRRMDCFELFAVIFIPMADTRGLGVSSSLPLERSLCL